jgi:5-methylcytosine-specific restriction endonuclease McrA
MSEPERRGAQTKAELLAPSLERPQPRVTVAGQRAGADIPAMPYPTYCDDYEDGGEGWLWKPGCGSCATCGGQLTDDQVARGVKWFCSAACTHWWRVNHDWNTARAFAIRRDRRCVRCGGDGEPREKAQLRPATDDDPRLRRRGRRLGRSKYAQYQRAGLEVNHRTPRAGGGYASGCHNHQEHLETLCRKCHTAETNRQAEERRKTARAAAAAQREAEVPA